MEIYEDDVLPLMQRFHQRLNNTSTRFKRYLYYKINWESRIVGIKGARGVGKTTLLLQRILESDSRLEKSLYVSLDDLWFSVHTLDQLVNYLYPRGITEFYLDEVHKYPGWARVFKHIYDSYPDVKIRYTGSALLAIDHSIADLSRRQSLYTLCGMSFREFLEYEDIISLPPLDIGNLLCDHVRIANVLVSKIKVLKYFLTSSLRHPKRQDSQTGVVMTDVPESASWCG